MPKIELKIARRSSHPWIFQKMVEKPEKRPTGGSVVDIVDKEGQWVGRGFYNGHSRIALRILTTNPEEQIDDVFFADRIEKAVALRRQFLGLEEATNGYRVVHSEGDGLSGLVVDRFADVIVVQFYSAGMFFFRQTIFDALTREFPGSSLYWFAEEHVQKQEAFDCYPTNPPDPTIIEEHGIKYHVAAGLKHKTGFFADQRDNRKWLASFSKDKRVLDICCNSGGFALSAKVTGGASEVTAIDLDEEVLALAARNARLNNAKIRFVQSDLFNWLRVANSNSEKFDVVVLDPAKQTRSREEIDFAIKRYVDMNKLALQVLAPGGLFLTCSCTGLISEEDFIDAVRRAAFFAGRTLQILKVTGAGPDHPFLAHVPEGRYLKAIWAKAID